ncbi:potassium channel family protein [Bogoriella caseilytica]|uniref:Trk system potassium uptake protein TrkA n=1 Tax=Bogoriella caseilytica TaxID=56055 RepID=A0A3N2BB99_9MICO|nr:TrkA family potassium uptake protein [Bogoriella caseilytica]ROR72354.1 trk system potassium uptake protein TrkA [Bogoriella caseilytica]
MSDKRETGTLVVGLGRFGSALANTLDKLGREVLAVEKDIDLAQQWSHRLAVVEADATNPDAVRQLGAKDFPVAVVGVGTSIEASVLVTANLVDLKVPQIWAKAISAEHGRILRRIGAHHVVYPEYDAGARVAHMVSGRMLDYIEMEDGFAVVKMRPPRETHGMTLGEAGIGSKYGVMVLGVKSPGEPFAYADSSTRIGPKDLLIVSGDSAMLEKFAHRS